MTRVADFNIMSTRKGKQGRVEVSSNHGSNKMNVFIHTPTTTGERTRSNKRTNVGFSSQAHMQKDPITGYPLPGFSYPEYNPHVPIYPSVSDVSQFMTRSMETTQDQISSTQPEEHNESSCPGCIALSEELTTSKNDVALAKLLATTFGHILKDNNVKLLANIIDNSGKVIVDLVSLVNLIAVVTGAPVETLAFHDVDYWEELKKIFDFAQEKVCSSMFICWGAQAALYHYYNVGKVPLKSKLFGVFEHTVNVRRPIVRGFDDMFFAPHSRHTTWDLEELRSIDEIEIISSSPEAGAYILVSKDQRFIFVSGHSEYDPHILDKEYQRDIRLGLGIDIPKNYYVNNDPTKPPIVRWRSHANLLFSNWLNYHVYQETPY